jgi:signal transduction histidine kinase
VVADHELRSGSSVAVDVDDLPGDAALATKIALYRVLAEALSNATRHGGGVDVRVHGGQTDGGLSLEVHDSGSGFDPSVTPRPGSLGLAGMRERAELLGGSLDIISAPGRGTVVRLVLPGTEAAAESA